MQRGFTLIEVLVSIAVIAVLAGIVGASVSKYTLNQALSGATAALAAELQSARSKTLSSEAGSQYGVSLQSDRFIAFRGAAYDSSDPSNEEHFIDDRIQISSIALAGGATSVVFDRLTGETSQSGTITLSLISDPSKQKVIAIQATGLITY